jgi:hypothetical protein
MKKKMTAQMEEEEETLDADDMSEMRTNQWDSTEDVCITH